MKIIYIVVSLIFVLLLSVQISAMNSQKNIESYQYQVVKIFEKFEIRNYETTLFSTVKLTTNNYKSSSSKGFSILAGYIFGGNESNEKIAMTSPVAMSLEDSMTMMFMVPKAYSKENLPKPDKPEIEFKEIPAMKVAAISFGGWANDDKIAEYKKQLINALDSEGIIYTNRFYFLGYNPPYELFNRRNEIIVALK